MLKALYILCCSLIGAAMGAIWIGDLSSVLLSIIGGLIGAIVGALFGKYIPFYEWFL
jgi:hypothetical protein